MNKYVCPLKTSNLSASFIGGKGANLTQLARFLHRYVPDGFCITVEAYRTITKNNHELNDFLNELIHVSPNQRTKISEISEQVRTCIEKLIIPQDIAEEIYKGISEVGESESFAVRSSGTSEDMLTLSFAGQYCSFLNINERNEILKHVSKCWASLFNERAVIYRATNGIDHRHLAMGIVVQRMISAEVAGVMFTADPISSRRKVITITVNTGPCEFLVNGLINADSYKIRDGSIIEKKIQSIASISDFSKKGDFPEKEPVSKNLKKQELSDIQILQLAELGKIIEEYFGSPQDIEWCFAEEQFYILQSRPITTLYPIPERTDPGNYVYVSLGHQQMMTDSIKPLGMSLLELTAFRPLYKAGGRFFVDITNSLTSSASRKTLIDAFEIHDPLTKNALLTITDRQDFIMLSRNINEQENLIQRNKANFSFKFQNVSRNPTIFSDLVKRNEESLVDVQRKIQLFNGAQLVDFILQDTKQLKEVLFEPQTLAVVIDALNAESWINEQMRNWLGENDVAHTFAQSAPNNITSQMGLDLLDVADVIRSYPEVIEYLQHINSNDLDKNLVLLEGGLQAQYAIDIFLSKHGMRCSGEIDITRTRWSENQNELFSVILSNIRTFENGESRRILEKGKQAALDKEYDLLSRLKLLPGGREKVKETRRVIDIFRNFIGYREYPKYLMINRFFVYKQALIKEADLLVQAKIIQEREDIYYLSLLELREVMLTKVLNSQLVSNRKQECRLYQRLTPPRVITSEGEIIVGKYIPHNFPTKAMKGRPVSSGCVEGRARIILSMSEANLADGDILVTVFTDPGWTLLFASIKALVTEVGGPMTHGAIIAREFGMPAVVGIENATILIKNGQRIRVNGTEGYVEILEDIN